MEAEGKKIVDYTILGSQSEFNLRDQVLEYLNNGWVPLGGVQVLKREYEPFERYFQSMIKYDYTITITYDE